MKILRILLAGIFVIAGLLYINSIIPAPQQTQAAVVSYNHSDSSGRNLLSVSMQDDSCGGYFKSGNDYSTTGTVTNNANFQIDGIQLHFKSYFCSQQSDLDSNGSGSCTKNFKSFNGPIFSLAPGQSMSFSTPTLHSTDYQSMSACGLFQNDFWFSYDNGATTSTYEGVGTGFGFAGAGYCHLWDGSTLASTNPWTPAWECNRTTPTPTPTSTPTPTPTPTVTATPTPTVTVTPTPTSSVCHVSECSHVIDQNGCGFQFSQASCSCVKVCPTPTVTPTPTTSVSCGDIDQNGNINNANCQNQNQNQTQGQTQDQNNNQTINNNANNSNTVNVNISNSGNNQQQQQQSQQQAVLGASVAPAVNANSLPSTGTGADVLLTLAGLIPLGLKLRKFV